MQRRQRDDAPEQPTGVKLVADDGHEYPCSVHFAGINLDGLAEWAVELPVPFEVGMSVRVATLPPRTALLFPFPVEDYS